ncbi:D-sedoheptulose-7-phosphate isomerase [Kordiimonas sp.]|uniref:D-sedoheptulose-7-phosphate isomerase n=1 Tax=Kordiimonas sp. TaxID=1970157 RepID=UPI003A912330
MTTTKNREALQSLYPFLHNKKSDIGRMKTALLDSINRKVDQHRIVIDTFYTQNGEAMVGCAQAIAATYRADGRLFAMGNGGSSSDASHIAVEFLHPVTTGRPALAAYDLTADKTLITALSNDVGFDHVFARQVANLARPGDCLIGISTSGNSTNIVSAFEVARKQNVTTIGLAGGDGGTMAAMGLDHCLVAPSDSIHRIQECHVTIYHVLWDLVHTLLADDRGNLGKASSPGANTHLGKASKKE